MKKVYLILVFFISTFKIFSQQWVWSKVIPTFPSYDYLGTYTAKTGDNYFIYNTSYNVTYDRSKILHLDPSGNITDSLILNFKVGKFSTDVAGNYLLAGSFTDSLNYSNTVVHSHGLHDFYLLKVTSSGNLIFLKSFGSPQDDYDIGSIQFDSTDKIYFTSILKNTLSVDFDSIVHDTTYDQMALLIFNQDGTFNSHISNSFARGPYEGYSSHYPGGITINNNGDIFIHYSYCYPYECDARIIKYSFSHDSLNSFQGGMIDNSFNTVYYFTNPSGHYYWTPVIHKYRLADHSHIWEKYLGGTYESFELSAILLPENLLLAFGRGGGPAGTGEVTLDDTTLTFGKQNEMLLALMDTSGHYYSVINEKVSNTVFRNASYDNSGNAYLISDWGNDTTYTMGTTIVTHIGDHVISKLNYNTIAAVPDKDAKNQFSIFPNPSKGIFNLILDDHVSPNHDLYIYDLLGKCIYFKKITGNSTLLDLSDKPKGIYFVEIKTGTEQINKKIILN